MPIYEYRCQECRENFTEFKKLADYKQPAVHSCGSVGVKQVSLPMIATDFPGYESPVTGKWIEGRKAHERELKETNCRILEPGEQKDLQRRQLDNDRKLDTMLDNVMGQVLIETKATKGDLNAGR